MIIIKKEHPKADSVFDDIRRRYAHYDAIKEKSDRDKIKVILLEEQRHICAYCMKRIKMTDSTTEHYIPGRSISDKHSLEYKNLLAVCSGELGNQKPFTRTCDKSKVNKLLVCNPTVADDMSKIYYSRSGRIYSENDVYSDDLDVTLNLNCTQLIRNRKSTISVLESELLGIREYCDDGDYVDYMRNVLYEYKLDLLYKPYIGAIIWFLEKMIEEYK